MLERPKNWAGNYSFSAVRFHRPETVSEVQLLVTRSPKVKILGAGHSFNGVADSREDLISLEKLSQVVSLDREKATVTVEGGVRYGELCRFLEKNGFGLPNLASLPHITVAGACATATHGSGIRNGNLATSVSAMDLVTAEGDLVTLSRDANREIFDGAVVGLGSLGAVTKLTLDLVPTFRIRQNVFENLPLSQAEEHLDEILAQGYSVSLFTDWKSERFGQVWIKQLVSADNPQNRESEIHQATPATRPVHPIAGVSPVHCTEQLGVPGPWHERLPHFRLDFTPSQGDELQSEYLVPRRQGKAALRAVSQLRGLIAPVLQVSEIRAVADDTLWLSPCYRQECVAFHFTWKNDWPAVQKILPAIEEGLAPFGARPHWGKLFTTASERLNELFVRLPDFRNLLAVYDPKGKFRNSFLETTIFGGG
jgi:xylitol oxidase